MPRGSHQLKIDLTDEQHREIFEAAKRDGITMAAVVRLRLSQYPHLESMRELMIQNQAETLKMLQKLDAAYATYPAHEPACELTSIVECSTPRKKA